MVREYSVEVPPNCPLVGGIPCFPWVKSGWLSKFWCISELFQISPEWSGPSVLFWMVSEWSGHHWMPLAGCPRLETQLMSFGQKVCKDPWSQCH